MKDLSMKFNESVKLNVRTTGVFLNKGKVLVHKCGEDGHYALPGGRVQMTEDSITALKREVKEELDLEVENVTFAGVIENFFKAPECDFHEYMWLIKADFVDKSVYNLEKIIGKEEEKNLEFEWIEIGKLKEKDFRPLEAVPYLEKLDNGIQHLIIREY